MSKKVGFLFAGQGSQYIGMGKDIYEKYDYVREMFSVANEILKFKLEDIIFEENNLINQTKYTQTSVLVVTCALYEVIKRELGITPNVVSGFSLGEYSALYASGIFSFSEIVSLVNYRANFMEEAANKTSGSMAAIIGMEKEVLVDLCNKVGNVMIANYNSPNQLVISGLKEKVEEVTNIVANEYKKRAVVLNVSGGFHSPLMKEAADNLETVLDSFNPSEPTVPIIMNYNANELDFSLIKEALTKQVYSPVYFSDTIVKMINDYNVEMFVEIGPGKVLSGFVKKIDRSKEIINFEKLDDIELYKESK